MQSALATRDMGQVMRAFRQHPFHGEDIPQAVAAGWVGVSQSRLSRIENGETLTDLGKLSRWARVLGLPAELCWFQGSSSARPAAAVPDLVRSDAFELTGSVLLPVVVNGQPVLIPLATDSLPPAGQAPQLEALVTTTREWDGMSPEDRRAVLGRGLSVAGLSALGLDELHHVVLSLTDAGKYLDASVVGYFRRQLAACAQDDGKLGPQKTLPAVLGVVQAVEQHAREVKPSVRRQLLQVGAQGAEFAGWLYRDVRDSGQATYWRDRATEWAQEAGDLAMQGYVLLKKSQAAYDDRDALRMLTLAQAVQDGPWDLPTKVRAEAAQQEARGHAMLGGQAGVVEAKLDQAQQLLTDATTAEADERPYGVHYNATLLTMQTAICYTEAGQPRRAADLYDRWLSLGTFSRRDYGYFRALMASALALAGEPDAAAAAGVEAAPLAVETASRRTMQELVGVLDVLKPWANHASVRELSDAVQV